MVKFDTLFCLKIYLLKKWLQEFIDYTIIHCIQSIIIN